VILLATALDAHNMSRGGNRRGASTAVVVAALLVMTVAVYAATRKRKTAPGIPKDTQPLPETHV
jgi:hypothetical protein